MGSVSGLPRGEGAARGRPRCLHRVGVPLPVGFSWLGGLSPRFGQSFLGGRFIKTGSGKTQIHVKRPTKIYTYSSKAVVQPMKWKFTERHICGVGGVFCQDLTFLLGEDQRISLKYPFAQLILSSYITSSFSGLLKMSAEALVLLEKAS